MDKQYETKRLYLKILSANDSLEVLDFYIRNKDFLEPFEPDRAPRYYTDSYHQAQLTYESHLMNESRIIRFYIYDKSRPQYIVGTVALQQITRGSYLCGTISYKIDHNYLRLGLATEAVSALIWIAFHQLGLHRIEAYILPHNIPSINLVKKIGFHYEGIALSSVILGGKWYDQARFALINDPQSPFLYGNICFPISKFSI